MLPEATGKRRSIRKFQGVPVTEEQLLQTQYMGQGTCRMGASPPRERMAAVAQFPGVDWDVVPFCPAAVGVPRRSAVTGRACTGNGIEPRAHKGDGTI